MCGSVRGFAIVVNFDQEDRQGSKRDLDLMCQLWGQLSFDVKAYADLGSTVSDS